MRSKARLTITLPPDLLREVDRSIDGQTFRNRSHAIEMLLRQALSPAVTTAVLLAGGDPPGGEVPALATIGGRTLLSLTLHHLREHGIERFVVLAGRHEHAIRSALERDGEPGAELRFVRETFPLGTAGALRAAARHLRSAPFLVVHADVLTNIDLDTFVEFHRAERCLATIAVKPRGADRSYGKVLLQGNRITEFLDRSGDRGVNIINTGVYVFEPEVLELIDADKPSRLETDVFPRLAARGELSAFFFQGIWFDISTPEAQRKAEARWQARGG